MDLIEKALATITRHNMLQKDATVLVGLSGGPDSVCLTLIMARLKERLGLKAIHTMYIDHGLRPTETPAEIAFCRALSERLGMEFHTDAVDVVGHAKATGLGKQEAARALRYDAFRSVLIKIGGERLALGHNQDDQCETFFMRAIRGSGAKGLTGIPPVRNHVMRPLIETPRAEIEAFLNSEGEGFVTDSSNEQDVYLRNRIRSSLIPLVKELNPNILDTITRTTDILNEEERYFFVQVTKKLMTLITRKSDQAIEMFFIPFESMDLAIARRVLRRAIDETASLRRIGLEHIDDILRLVRTGKSGDSIDLPGGIKAYKKYSTFVITSEEHTKLGVYTLAEGSSVKLAETGQSISARVIDKKALEEMPPPSGLRACVLDADRLDWPLTIRPRKDGDHFQPMGMGHGKKLQDFLTDLKVPRVERDSVPIVCSADGEIAWVAGYRADERFRPTESTTRYVMLELHEPR